MVEIGTITRNHGFRGAVVAVVPSGKTCALGRLLQVRIGNTELDAKLLTIEEAAWMPSGWKLKLSGIDTEEAAQELRGKKLFVPREELPEVLEGEYYLVDLVGSVGIDTLTNQPVGLFDGIEEGAGNRWWRFVSQGRELLVPPNKRYLSKVDVAAKQIWLTALEELP